MTQYNLRGEADGRKWEIIEYNHKLAQERFEHIQRELADVIRNRLRLKSELAQKCVSRYQKADELLFPLVIAVRKELDTPFDEEAYRRIGKESQTRVKMHMDAYISSLKAKLEEWLDRAGSGT